MPATEENKRISCSKCKPPTIQTTKSDEWKCGSCGLEFRLDRDSRTWWPKQWWSFKQQRDEEIAKADQLTALDTAAARSQDTEQPQGEV